MAVSLRLMSVNLLHERCDALHFARVVADLSPDVVVTQELGSACAEVLAGAYPNHRLRPAPDYTGRGIATRFDVEFHDLEMPGRQSTAATLSARGTTIRLAGAHLCNPIDFPWWTTARIRGKQVETLLEWADSAPGPIAVAGDFNASPIWPAYRRVAERLTDLIDERSSALGESTRPTWGWRPGWPRMLRIDHVFGRDLRVADYLLVPIKGSDHVAIVADMVVEPTGT